MSELLSAEALFSLSPGDHDRPGAGGRQRRVIGHAAAGLPTEQRNRAFLVGIIAATVLRVVFAGLTTQLLEVVGLLLAGGILLLWVCWKMWRELQAGIPRRISRPKRLSKVAILIRTA